MRTVMGTLLAAATVVSSGCASNHREVHNWLMAYRESNSSIDYRVGIPDAIRITAPRIPEIDGEQQTIQPDGKITLRLLGEVRVDGMTAREIAAKLTELLREYYEAPKVQVRVARFESKKVYVFGQVGSRGTSGGGSAMGGGQAVVYTGRNTLLDTLADAGLSLIAWRSRVKVIRADPEKHKRHVLIVNVDKMFEEGDTSMNVLLEPGDIVYVPPTPLGWLGLRIQEVLFPFAPVFNAYTLPGTVIGAHRIYDEENLFGEDGG
ncbi:MAG: polysaccharide biosynthesis/export family protein [Phycisphaerales bacterium]|nr:MAG: polysaccharide biosynthesis/export family protein [Phycisphaerales bacterium]